MKRDLPLFCIAFDALALSQAEIARADVLGRVEIGDLPVILEGLTRHPLAGSARPLAPSIR